MHSGTRFLSMALLMLMMAGPVAAIDFQLFRDSEDGGLDISDWLLTKKGFLPVPIIVTEPAVGYGVGLAVAFFHSKPGVAPGEGEAEGYGLPPSISVAAYGGTENGTRFGVGGHFGSWKDDSIRYPIFRRR